MGNTGVRQASNRLILFCDSDDWLLNEALQRLQETQEFISECQRANHVGITAPPATKNGFLTNPLPNVSCRSVSQNDLAEIQHVTSDMLFFARAESFKDFPSPQIDLPSPESMVWNAVGHKPARLIPEILKMVEYQVENRISFTSIMAYNRERVPALAAAAKSLWDYQRAMKTCAQRFLTFIHSSTHGELNFHQSRRQRESKTARLAYVMALQVAKCLAIKDRPQGKAYLTRRMVLASQTNAVMTIENLNEQPNV